MREELYNRSCLFVMIISAGAGRTASAKYLAPFSPTNINDAQAQAQASKHTRVSDRKEMTFH